MRLNVVQEPLSYCSACSLNKARNKRTHYVPMDVIYNSTSIDGRPRADLVFVGDFPERMDDFRGLPFCDTGGQYIRDLVTEMGLSESVAFTSVLKCRPVDDNDANRIRLPGHEDESACVNYLRKDLNDLLPKVVILVGSIALKKVPSNPAWVGKNVASVQGDIWRDDMTGITYIPVVHPSSFLSNEKLGNTARQRNSSNSVSNYSVEKRFRNHINLAASIIQGNLDDMATLGNDYYLSTIAEVMDLVDLLKSLDYKKNPDHWAIGLDYETENVNRVAPNRISCVQFAPNNFDGYIVPLEHYDSPWNPEQLKVIREILKDLFTDSNAGFQCWVAHNDQFDLDKTLRFLDLPHIAKPTINPIFMEFLIDENQRDSEGGGYEGGFALFNLKTMARERLGFNHYDLDLLSERSSGNFWNLPLADQSETAKKFRQYCAMDAYVGRRLACKQRSELTEREFDFALKWGSRVSHLFIKMERNGIWADMDQLKFLKSDHSPILRRMEEIPEEIYSSEEGKKANVAIVKNSPKTSGQKPLFGFNKLPRILDISKKEHQSVLFVDTCGLTPIKYCKDGSPSIDKEYLKAHDSHPLIEAYSEYSGLNKLRTSYLNSVEDFLTKEKIVVRKRIQNNYDNLFDGRIHSNFGYDKTVSGRPASWGPNIQQLPRGENFYRKMIKSLYGAPIGFIYIESDYGQAEIRWWANISGDKEFIKLLWRMKEILDEYLRSPTADNKKRVEALCDIHRQVAAIMFQKNIEDVTKFERQVAKSLAFGAIFGQSTHALAQILKTTEEEAEASQMKFLSQFEAAGQWLTDIERFAERHGYVENPYGRRRHIKHLFAQNPGAAKRMARNSPIQSANSDTLCMAAYCLQARQEEHNLPYKIVNMVHDSLSFQVPLSYDAIEETIHHVKDCMNNINDFVSYEFGVNIEVPLVNDFKIGPRWGHAIDWDEGEPLSDIVDQCKEWDDMLRSGVQWWQIATVMEKDDLVEKIGKIENNKELDDRSKDAKIFNIKREIQALERSMLEYAP